MTKPVTSVSENPETQNKLKFSSGIVIPLQLNLLSYCLSLH